MPRITLLLTPRYATHSQLEGYQVFIEALCLIDFGDDKISHTRELAKNLKLRELYPAVGDCYRIKPDTCAKSNYTGNPEHICPAPATPTPVDGGNHDEQCIAEPHATDRESLNCLAKHPVGHADTLVWPKASSSLTQEPMTSRLLVMASTARVWATRATEAPRSLTFAR